MFHAPWPGAGRHQILFVLRVGLPTIPLLPERDITACRDLTTLSYVICVYYLL